MKWVFAVVVFLGLGAAGAFFYSDIVNALRSETPSLSSSVDPGQPAQTPSVPAGWPPRVGQEFPDLELVDQTGKLVRLSSFRGKVLIIEPIGMTCPACNAFSGADRHGPFPGASAQQGLQSFKKLFDRYVSGVSLRDDRIVFVQLLLYSMSMGAPTPEDTRKWATHFGLKRHYNEVVLTGTPQLLSDESYRMVPGFQLVDKAFVLRVDSTGHNPRHRLEDLFARLPALVKQKTPGGGISRAYQAIPHRQTTYRTSSSALQAQDAQQLESLFRLIDLALVERVQMLSALHTGKPRIATYRRKTRRVSDQLRKLSVPASAERSRELIVQALSEQQRFFDKWSEARDYRVNLTGAFIASDADVKSSHRHLVQAYDELMHGFPAESEHNKQAFFDHLCALDFI